MLVKCLIFIKLYTIFPHETLVCSYRMCHFYFIKLCLVCFIASSISQWLFYTVQMSVKFSVAVNFILMQDWTFFVFRTLS